VKKKIGIIILVLWLFRSGIFALLNIEFSKVDYAEDFRQIWLVLFPLAVLLMVIEDWKKNKWKWIRYGVLIAFSVGFIIVANFFGNFCSWKLSEPVYQHKTENRTLRYRELDCGAHDSDPSYILVETESFTKYFYTYTEVKIPKLNLKNWNKIERY
jgi:hypothetical protein